jgi:cytochrome c-type biogenesis protein CcmH
MPAEASETSRTTRIILAVAALIAVTAVGLAVWKRSAPVSLSPASVAGAPQGNASAMISELEAKLKADPDDADSWRMLGWAFFETGKFAEAATAYARATQIDPKKAEYWSSLGEAKVMTGPGDVPTDAKSAFEKAVALDPKDPRARYFLAVARDIAGDHQGAIEDWLALLADTPAGAPWEADVRRLIADVGAKEKIDVASRLAAIRPALATGGAAIATAAIPGPTAQDMRSASQMPKGQQDAMIQGMVDGLEAKLKANPKNAPGWIMLMRSRMSLGETAKASGAYTGARAAFAGDAATLSQLDAAARELGVR